MKTTKAACAALVAIAAIALSATTASAKSTKFPAIDSCYDKAVAPRNEAADEVIPKRKQALLDRHKKLWAACNVKLTAAVKKEKSVANLNELAEILGRHGGNGATIPIYERMLKVDKGSCPTIMAGRLWLAWGMLDDESEEAAPANRIFVACFSEAKPAIQKKIDDGEFSQTFTCEWLTRIGVSEGDAAPFCPAANAAPHGKPRPKP